MNARIWALLVIALLLAASVSSQKKKSNKKTSVRVADMQKKLQALLNRPPKGTKMNRKTSPIRKKKRPMKVKNAAPVQVYESPEPTVIDPCDAKHCSAGRECIIDSKGEAHCPCIKECPEFDDERRMVCSNFNETWSSDCKLHQMRCFCSEDSSDCPDEKFAHMHIDYFGKCQEAQECKENEMADFPRRMKEWMFNIMREMADDGILPDSFKDHVQEEADEWVNAAVIKWCLLDEEPKDSHVSRHELFPLRAPLHAMEHCISPFLDQCDANDNHEITLTEWITCLELEKDHISEIEDLCDEIRPTGA